MVSRIGAKKKSSGSGGFKYKKRTADDVKKRAEQSGGRFDSPFKPNIDIFRPKDGENLVRILPPTWEDHDHYGLDVWMHRFIGADNSNYLCANKMLGKHCPACDEAKLAKDAGEDDEAKALQPQKRTLVWLIDRDDESNTPQVWDMSWAQDRDIAALCHIKRTGKVLLIDHPDEGYDLTIKKVGKGLKTRYTFIVDRESSPIHEDQDEMDKILEFIEDNPLTEVLRYDTAAHIEKQLSGTAPAKDKDLDDDEDDKPRKKKRARDDDDEDEKPKRRRGRDEEEEEEEEDRKPAKRRRSEPEDEDEDEDEKPKKRRRVEEEEEEEDEKPKKRRRADPEDEEEEEEKPRRRKRAEPEEDEEEEEEKPKKRRRSEPEDEDEEEEEKPKKRRRAEPEEEEEEEDERPAKKRKRVEPEEDEEEEEDEDEKPRRRR